MSGRRNSNRGLIGGDYSSTGGIQGLVFHEQSKRGGYGGGGGGASQANLYGILVGGGGGSGGLHGGNAIGAGGAGGGGMVEATFTIYANQTYNCVVGTGGVASTGTGKTGTNGGDTYFEHSSGIKYFTALGGGGGGFYASGANGGCGGASGYNLRPGGVSIQTSDTYIGQSSGTYIDNPVITVDSAAQYGFDGGLGPGFQPSGGGGGTAEDGDDRPASGVDGTDGGDGRQAADGNRYGGGGGGAKLYNSGSGLGGSGGLGGGGKGGGANSNAANGTFNTGGGGGGGYSATPGGNGGTGILILFSSEPLVVTGSPTEEDVSETIGLRTYTKKYTFNADGAITGIG